MDLVTKLKNIILPKQYMGRLSSKRNKVSLVIDEIVCAFEESIEQMSTERTLMFHTAYVVYVPHSNFRDLHLAFGVATQEAVERFNEILVERLKKNRNLRMKPICDSWSFDIISLKEEGSDIPDEDNPDSRVTYEDLEENFVAVRSSFVPTELYNFTALDEDAEVKTNRSKPNSKYENMQRLSIRAIAGLKPSGTGYSYPISIEGVPVAPVNSALNNDEALATLKSCDGISFLDAHKNKYSIFDIRLTDMFFGGRSASPMYQGKPMVALDSETIQSPHFEIRRDTDGGFYIRPIGDVEVNQIPATRNKWTRLSDKNTTIKLNGSIEFVFNKK
ncbi:MAG: hypothetical protein K2M41_00335 [Muribaculaceae bacterium]|nr:hypothetical protein [Muribaculaceae bacterium]